jgi:hypothetical protein
VPHICIYKPVHIREALHLLKESTDEPSRERRARESALCKIRLGFLKTKRGVAFRTATRVSVALLSRTHPSASLPVCKPCQANAIQCYVLRLELLTGHVIITERWWPLSHYCTVTRFYSQRAVAGSRGRSSSPGRVKNFLFSTSSRPVQGPTQPPIQWVPGSLFPGVKRPEREADQSPPANAEVKKVWIYTCTPLYAFMT